MGSKVVAAILCLLVAGVFVIGCKSDEGRLEDAKSPDAGYTPPAGTPEGKPMKPMGKAVSPGDVK